MDSTAFLRRGFSTPPPICLPTAANSVAGQLPLTFCCNVSSIRLLVEKSNENYNNYGRCNKNNNGIIDIRCGKRGRKPPRSTGGSQFPSPNAKMALQSLLCFSFDNAVTEHSKDIVTGKKEALQALLAGNPDRAMRIMRDKYKKIVIGQSMKYDATLALIQILIYVGTTESLAEAIQKLNEISAIPDKDKPSDSKPTLYRAIIYTLLGNQHKNVLEDYWLKYIDNIGSEPV